MDRLLVEKPRRGDVGGNILVVDRRARVLAQLRAQGLEVLVGRPAEGGADLDEELVVRGNHQEVARPVRARLRLAEEALVAAGLEDGRDEAPGEPDDLGIGERTARQPSRVASVEVRDEQEDRASASAGLFEALLEPEPAEVAGERRGGQQEEGKVSHHPERRAGPPGECVTFYKPSRYELFTH